MKKFLKTAIVALATFGMAACGGNNTPEEPGEERCTEHEDGYTGWFLTGPDGIKVNGVKASENKGAEWDFGGDSFEFTQIQLADVEAISSDIHAGLVAQGTNLKAVYKLENVTFGTETGAWSAKFKKDGKMYSVPNSYCLKVIKTKYSEELDVWATQKWTPNAHDANVEALGGVFIPAWQETADEDGFDWTSNPVVYEAGVYTVVFAEYNSITEDGNQSVYGYGLGAVKTGNAEGAIAPEEISDWVAEDHTYGIIGKFNGWGADVAMTKDGSAWVGECTVTTLEEGGGEFKIRADGDWSDSWGAESVVSGQELMNGTSGNINVKEVGTYRLELTFSGSKAEIKLSKRA